MQLAVVVVYVAVAFSSARIYFSLYGVQVFLVIFLAGHEKGSAVGFSGNL
jgi:hypothetical protein